MRNYDEIHLKYNLMPYNIKLADRVREALINVPKVEEKFMFGGICFMVDGKMCMGVTTDELMCRIDPEREEEALAKRGCRHMDFTGRPMKGYVFVGEEGMKTKKEFNYWIQLCLEFNSKAKSSKKAVKKAGTAKSTSFKK
jgi:TfoX/Sxy family transcriptional regulator of competence genes